MIIYMALALAPILIGCLFPDLNQNPKQKKYFLVICGFVLLIMLGFRHYSLGSTDTRNYCNAMQRAINCTHWSEYYNPESYEAGAQLFIFILSRIFDAPQWLLIITSMIYVAGIFYFLYHNSEELVLSVVAYVTLGLMQFHMQGMRQSIAMCICLFAYEQAKNRKLIKFIFLVLLATTFHQTAIVFFSVYILCAVRYSVANIAGAMALSALVTYFSKDIISIGNDLFEKEYNVTSKGGFVAAAIYIVIFVATLIYYHNKSVSTKTPLLYILIVGMCCYNMRGVGGIAVERISFYFAFSQLALLPKVIGIITKQDKNMAYLMVVIFSVMLFAYRLHGSDLIPYKFFWQI